MKYKEFVVFAKLREHAGCNAEYIIEQAQKIHGLSKWKARLFFKMTDIKYTHGRNIRNAVRKIGRVVWWCLMFFCAFVFFNRVNKLIDMTTYKNQTEVARNVVYVCGQMPDICPSAAELVKKVMK